MRYDETIRLPSLDWDHQFAILSPALRLLDGGTSPSLVYRAYPNSGS